MAIMSDYLRNKLVDFLFRGQTFAPGASMYAALFTATPTHAGGGTEVTGGSYARFKVDSTLADWAPTQGGASTSPSSGSAASAVTSNNATITFPAPTANWGTITGVALMDSPTGGNMLFFSPLAVSKTVNNGDAAPAFAANAMSWTLDQ